MPGLANDRRARVRRTRGFLVLALCALVASAAPVVVPVVPSAAAGALATPPPAVHPLVILSIDDERLSFSALGRDWEIALEPRELLSPGALAELVDVDLPRLFGGRVIGDEASWVRVSRDAGRLSGHLFAAGALYRIEPPPDARGTSATDAVATDAVESGDVGYRLVRVGGHADPASGFLPRKAVDARAVSRAMRVGIVVDSRYDEHHGGRGLARALSVMNGVDGLYREQLGLAVVVERVRVHDDPATDPIRTRGGTIEEVLTAFRGIRLGDPGMPADLALVHLFSGHEPADDVIGLGWIDTVCRVDGFDVSMSTPFAYDTLLSAHEIAHNLGALHDEDPRCEREDGTSPVGLMEERLSRDTVAGFSACSRESLQRVLGADCLLDSLDLALDVVVSAGTAPDERIVSVRVTNGDPLRTARAVRTRTRLPAGGRIDRAADGCRVSAELLVCEHGDIAPEAAAAVTAFVTPPEDAVATDTVAVIDPGTFVDSDPANDRVAFDLGVADAAQIDGRPADDPSTDRPVAGTPTTSTNGGGGGDEDVAVGGGVSASLLWLLVALAGGRLAGRRRRYRSRSTEYSATLSSASR